MRDLSGKKNPRYRTGLSGTNGLYNSWQNMKQRCLNPNHPKYERYGGRGICICPEWLNIMGFNEWAEKSGYQPGLTIDRKDNDGDYCPVNCEWITPHANSRKKQTTKLTFDQAAEIRKRLESGENPYTLAEEYGVVHGTIWFIQKRFTHVPDGECAERIRSSRQYKLPNSSQFRGVTRSNHKWQAQITIDGENHYLGRFETELDAHEAYLAARKRLVVS